MSESGIQQPSIAILMESDYYEPEISYYQRRFDEVGIRVDFVGRLWGQPSLTFTGHRPGAASVRRAIVKIPAGLVHGFENTGEGDLTFLVTHDPPYAADGPFD